MDEAGTGRLRLASTGAEEGTEGGVPREDEGANERESSCHMIRVYQRGEVAGQMLRDSFLFLFYAHQPGQTVGVLFGKIQQKKRHFRDSRLLFYIVCGLVTQHGDGRIDPGRLFGRSALCRLQDRDAH